MFRQYVGRGAGAGAVAGVAFAAGTAATADAPAHAHHALRLPAAATLVAGVLWGTVLGAAFGGTFFLLEPWLAGRDGGGSGSESGSWGWSEGALAAVGFLTVSGAPWLVLPPGVESTLPAAVRVGWYAAAMVAGAVAAGLALAAVRRRLALVPIPLAALVALASLGPSPSGVAALGAWVEAPGVVAGQVGLWAVLAVAHGQFRRRSDPAAPGPGDGDGAALD